MLKQKCLRDNHGGIANNYRNLLLYVAVKTSFTIRMADKYLHFVASPVARNPLIVPVVVRSNPMELIVRRRNVNNDSGWSRWWTVHGVSVCSGKKRD